MSSFRNHRVIIASLFLPSTAVLGESHPSTPELGATRAPPPPPMRLPETVHMPRPGPVHRPTTTPVLSLVDDLKDKVCSPFHVRFCFTWLAVPWLRVHNILVDDCFCETYMFFYWQGSLSPRSLVWRMCVCNVAHC